MAQYTTYNQDPNLAYHCFLNLGMNAAAPGGTGYNITSSLQPVCDGDGNASALQISSGAVFVNGTLTATTFNQTLASSKIIVGNASNVGTASPLPKYF